MFIADLKDLAETFITIHNIINIARAEHGASESCLAINRAFINNEQGSSTWNSCRTPK